MKKLLLCLGFCLLLSGCGSYRELNDVVIVSGGGLEQAEDQTLTLTSQLVTLPEGETTPKPELVTVTGQTPASAFDALGRLTGKIPYWSHCQTFLLGEELTRSGVTQTIQTLLSDPEIRLTDRLLVTAGAEPEAVLAATAAAGEISGYDLYTLVSAQAADLDMPLYRFADTLLDEGADPVLPAVTLTPAGKPALLGTAIFHDDRLAGYLNADQTQIMLLLQGRIRAMPLILDNEETYLLDSAHCRIVPSNTEQGLVFTVHLSLKARPQAGTGSVVQLEKTLKNRIAALFSILQTDLQADSLGLMRQAQRYLPLSPDADWQAAYRSARLRTDLTLTLSAASSVTQPQEVTPDA